MFILPVPVFKKYFPEIKNYNYKGSMQIFSEFTFQKNTLTAVLLNIEINARGVVNRLYVLRTENLLFIFGYLLLFHPVGLFEFVLPVVMV